MGGRCFFLSVEGLLALKYEKPYGSAVYKILLNTQTNRNPATLEYRIVLDSQLLHKNNYKTNLIGYPANQGIKPM